MDETLFLKKFDCTNAIPHWVKRNTWMKFDNMNETSDMIRSHGILLTFPCVPFEWNS